MRGATYINGEDYLADVNFNPRAHEGRDENAIKLKQQYPEISIHAPMRGATRNYKKIRTSQIISIHAPMRGATLKRIVIPNGAISISIHAPMRGATPLGDMRVKDISRISIHAPMRGATACIRVIARITAISIHAPMRGATISSSIIFFCSSLFQSTRP